MLGGGGGGTELESQLRLKPKKGGRGCQRNAPPCGRGLARYTTHTHTRTLPAARLGPALCPHACYTLPQKDPAAAAGVSGAACGAAAIWTLQPDCQAADAQGKGEQGPIRRSRSMGPLSEPPRPAPPGRAPPGASPAAAAAPCLHMHAVSMPLSTSERLGVILRIEGYRVWRHLVKFPLVPVLQRRQRLAWTRRALVPVCQGGRACTARPGDSGVEGAAAKLLLQCCCHLCSKALLQKLCQCSASLTCTVAHRWAGGWQGCAARRRRGA